MIQIKTLPQNPGTVEGGHFSYLFLKKKEQGKPTVDSINLQENFEEIDIKFLKGPKNRIIVHFTQNAGVLRKLYLH